MSETLSAYSVKHQQETHKTNLSPLIHQQATLLLQFSAKQVIQHFSLTHSFLHFFLCPIPFYLTLTRQCTHQEVHYLAQPHFGVFYGIPYTPSTSIHSTCHPLKSLNGVTIANISDIVFLWLC